MSKNTYLNQDQITTLHAYLSKAVQTFIEEAPIPAGKEDEVIPLKNAGIYIEDLYEYLSGEDTEKLDALISKLEPHQIGIPNTFKALEALQDLAKNGNRSVASKEIFGEHASGAINAEAFKNTFTQWINSAYSNLKSAYTAAEAGTTRENQLEATNLALQKVEHTVSLQAASRPVESLLSQSLPTTPTSLLDRVNLSEETAFSL